MCQEMDTTKIMGIESCIVLMDDALQRAKRTLNEYSHVMTIQNEMTLEVEFDCDGTLELRGPGISTAAMEKDLTPLPVRTVLQTCGKRDKIRRLVYTYSHLSIQSDFSWTSTVKGRMDMAEFMSFSIHGIRPGGHDIELLHTYQTVLHAVPPIPQASLNVNCGHPALSAENWSRLQEHVKKHMVDPSPFIIVILKSSQWPAVTIKSQMSQPVMQPPPAAMPQPYEMNWKTSRRRPIMFTMQMLWSLLATGETAHMVGKRLHAMIVPRL